MMSVINWNSPAVNLRFFSLLGGGYGKIVHFWNLILSHPIVHACKSPLLTDRLPVGFDILLVAECTQGFSLLGVKCGNHGKEAVLYYHFVQ